MAGFETRYLGEALDLAEDMERLFGDGRGGYFDTGVDAETVLTRGRSRQDGAVPSGASVAAWNLLRLGRITGRQDLWERGEQLLRASMGQVERYPAVYAQLLIGLDFALGPCTEIVLATGEDGAEPEELLEVVRRRFLPRAVILEHRPGDGELERLAPPASDKEPIAADPPPTSARARPAWRP